MTTLDHIISSAFANSRSAKESQETNQAGPGPCIEQMLACTMEHCGPFVSFLTVS